MSERQIGRRKYHMCTECEIIHSTFAQASRCHYGIGGVVSAVYSTEAVAEHNQEVEAEQAAFLARVKAGKL